MDADKLINLDRLMLRLRRRQWACGLLSGWLTIGTPWFVIMITHPTGALDWHRHRLVTGFKILYRWNWDRKAGQMHWMKEKRVYFSNRSIGRERCA